MESFFKIAVYLTFIKIFCENNFDTNDSDMNFILLQRRFDASYIIFKLQVRTIRITFTFN